MQALVLGTAQWGDAYGVTNALGRLGDAQLVDLMDAAAATGIRAVDTAPAYGQAETRLRPWASALGITTKVKGSDERGARPQVLGSLERLGVGSVDACLVHDWHDLTPEEERSTVAQLRGVQEEGLVSAVGVSAYDESDLLRAEAAFGRLDVVQVPISALDRRLEHSAVIRRLSEAGGRVQARSIFLQGLLAGRSSVPLGSHPDVVAFHDAVDVAGWPAIGAAVSYVRGLDWVSEVVVGVVAGTELQEIATAWSDPIPGVAETVRASDDLTLLDPRTWA